MKHKFLLTLMLLIAAFTANASHFTVDGITYTTNGNEATVGDAAAGDLIIPETVTYEGVTYSVTAIGEQVFAYRDNITSVTIPRSITSIKPNAFFRCTGLISVTIDNASTAIGYQAFANCFYLTNLDLGNSVSSIEQGAFANCYKMMDVEIPNTVNSIGKYAFSACVEMTNLMIPSSVTYIDSEAFKSCSGLIQITVDKNNTHYDSRNNCNALIETSTNTLIAGCSNTIIPNTVEAISDYAFYSCKMRSMRIPNSVTSIGDYAFGNCSELTDITIGNSVTTIGEYAFFQCSNLKYVSFGNSVSTIGKYAFQSCYNLKYLNLPSSVTVIDDGAFGSCDLLGLTINSDITIGQSAFNCQYLTSFTIGESVTSIDISMFSIGNYDLKSVTCLATTPPTCISGFSYYIYSRATLYVPEVSISAYESADYWQNFYSIYSIIDDNIPVVPDNVYYYYPVDDFYYDLYFSSNDPEYSGTAMMVGRVWDFDGETYSERQLHYDEWNTDSIYYIPQDILTEYGIFKLTCIGGGFSGQTDIKTVYVPSTVNRMESGFSRSSLESIVFVNDWAYNHQTPIRFGEYANFQDCERLTTVEFEKPLYSISPEMFMDCPNLKNIYFNLNNSSLDSIGACAFYNCSGLAHFDVPNSVKVIGEGAFAQCHNLESIYLPDNLTTINNFAFAECYQLDGITFNPSLKSIGDGAFLNCWSLSSVSIPDDISTINAFTFYDCRNLTDLDLNNASIFEEHAFAGCNKLTSLDLTKAQSIGEAAFFGGTVTCSVWIASSEPIVSIAVREEGWGTPEQNLGSLKKITLGDNISVLNERTFVGHIPDTITCTAPAPPIFSRTDNYDWVFSVEANQNTILRVPQALVNDYREAYGWSRFVNIESLSGIEPGDIDGDGVLNVKDVTDLIDLLLSGNATNMAADVNGDGTINVADVTALIDKLLSN